MAPGEVTMSSLAPPDAPLLALPRVPSLPRNLPALPPLLPAPTRLIPSLPTLDPALLAPTLAPPRPSLFPLDRLRSPALQRFYLARAGVYHTVRHWLGGARATVLMPAYHHGVEVEAVRSAGADILFYRVDRNLALDLDDLAEKAALPSVRVVYLTHFVGFAQPVARVREIVRSHNKRLFEDCALALFSRTPEGQPLGSFGDAACFCLYKTLPLPHGGLLLGPDVPTAPLVAPPLLSTLHHLAGLTLAHLELGAPTLGRNLGRALGAAARAAARATVDKAVATVQTGTMHLAAHELGRGASHLIAHLLPRFDDEMVVVRRRRNFARLAAALEEVLPVVGAPLLPGACPLFLPVRIGAPLIERGLDKGAVMQALHARGIDAIDFWSRGDSACDLAQFPEVAALRRELLELPIHQSLDDDAIDLVAHAVKQVVAHA
jgi:dTDP-4-amino-4,6-dideoxygalactose transaminase